jgi:tetratricopeptide (TPR) repeat protein
VLSEYLSAYALIQSSDEARAETYVDNVRQIVTGGDYEKLYQDFVQLLEAELHLKRGDSSAAEQALEEATFVTRGLSSHYHFLMGRIMAAKGETSVAAGFYEDLCRNTYMVNPRLGGDNFDFFLGCSMSNYFLGRLYENAGDSTRAVEYFESALEQWKDADADMRALLDTKARLKTLRAELE